MAGSAASTGLAARVLPAFTLSGSLCYFLVMGFGLSPFIYYPETGRFTIAPQPDLGLPMLWYGWLVYSALAGLAGGTLAWLLPARRALVLAGRLAWLLWFVPTILLLVILNLLRHYF